MTEEQIQAAINYIKTHVPCETELETIDIAISSVAQGVNAATTEDLVNQDDAWLIPTEERKKFVGIKGRGWVQSFDEGTIRAFKDAVQFVRTQRITTDKYNHTNNVNSDVIEMMQMRSELLNSFSKNDYSDTNSKIR